jgi:hypothetical protein
MKKHLSIVLSMLLSMVIIAGCNKDSAPKDYTASIKDKTWWGTLTNTGQTKEYYSVHFNGDSTLAWSQRVGNYDGKWVVKGKQLTMTFPTLNVEIKADIGDDNKLVNITDNNNFSTVNSGELVGNPTISLNNTIWTGTITINGNSTPLQLSFAPVASIDIKIGNVVYPHSYSRSASGGAFRNGKGFFGVLTGENEMRGSDTNADRPWQATKQ